MRIALTGVKSFWVITRDKAGKQKWVRLGDTDGMGIDAARDLAMVQLRLIRSSTDATKPIVVNTSFEAVAAKFLELHVEKNNLRSDQNIRRYFKRVLLPAFSGTDFVNVRRRHISELLDRVQKDSGTRASDYTLSIISKMCRWYALRDDEYESPIIPGMKRGGSNARKRVLNDVELATLWKADGLLGNFSKLALLTAQRVDKICTMKWVHVVDGTWYIETAPREKGNAGSLQLPQLALDVLQAQREIGDGEGEFVFGEGARSALKRRIERERDRLEERTSMAHFTLHDFRRTARSLMAAAGVPELHAELVMGHALKGVVGIYNRHAYDAEKGDVLQRLANRVRDIVTPPPSNVERLKRHKVS